jgi:hypothetical protein
MGEKPMILRCHPVAGVKFSAADPSLWRHGEVRQYDESGHNISMGYGGRGLLAGVEATVYVYPARASTHDQLTDALQQIVAARPETTILANGIHSVLGMDGLWAQVEHQNDRESPLSRVRSLTWVFSSDGWMVKCRCTNWQNVPDAEVEGGLSDLLVQLGAPDTSIRIATRKRQALAASTAAMRSLLDWVPIVDPLARSTQARIHALTQQGLLADAVTLLTEQLQVLPSGGLNAELSRLHLMSGELLDAVEMFLAEKEEESGQTAPLEEAIRRYVPDVTYGAGWGAYPQCAVTIADAPTLAVDICAEHRFLDFTLGQRGAEWVLDRASLVVVDDQLYDMMQVRLASGDSVNFFFKQPSVEPKGTDRVLGSFVTGGTTRGEPPDLNAEGVATPTSKFELGDVDGVPPDVVIKHLMTHSSITLALAGDEMF